MLRLVQCDWQEVLWDCPLVPTQLLSEEPSLKRVWACVLGPVLPDWDSAAVSSEPCQSPLQGPVWSQQVLPSTAPQRDEANRYSPQRVV